MIIGLWQTIVDLYIWPSFRNINHQKQIPLDFQLKACCVYIDLCLLLSSNRCEMEAVINARRQELTLSYILKTISDVCKHNMLIMEASSYV